MGKKISVSELRNQLTTLLDQLEQGHSHFVIERNNREVAVLLSMEKFQDIMQMLELLNTLEYIETGAEGGWEQEPAQVPGAAKERSGDFPDLTLLPPVNPESDGQENVPARSRPRSSSSIEEMANKLGIRVIK